MKNSYRLSATSHQPDGRRRPSSPGTSSFAPPRRASSHSTFHIPHSTFSSSQRRGTVLVMVVGLLAMLFVMGATQLMVARFEKQNASKKSGASNLKGTAALAYLPLADMLQMDALLALAGTANTDGIYDATSQDMADFSGTATVYPGGVSQTIQAEYQLYRSGDALLASIEPFWNGTNFAYFATSMSTDTATLVANLPVNGRVPAQSTGGHPMRGDYGDADGDGVTDAMGFRLMSATSGTGYRMFQRIVAHGGMVMLDRTTHPALLAQVIHPSDGEVHSNPMLLFQPYGPWSATTTDEARLRRRGMLPDSTDPNDTDKWQQLASSYDLRTLLPVTLGFVSPGSRLNGGLTPHWRPVENNANEQEWLDARWRPMVALTENGYNPSSDYYDRRHIVTTESYDDLLRPQRDEMRLLQLPTGPATYQPVAQFHIGNFTAADAANLPNNFPGRHTSLYYVLNPQTTADVDSKNFSGTQGRIYDTMTSTPTSPPLAYGMVPDANGYNWSLAFNRPGLRTPFSLRDVLVKPQSYTAGGGWADMYKLVDDSYSPLNWGYQASYQRAMQLAANYLAMIQHTTVPGSAQVFNTAAGTVNPDAWDLAEQMKTAFQLAVNTIDFADNADINGNGWSKAVDTATGEVSFDNGDVLTSQGDTRPVDPLTAMSFADINSGQTVTVYGYEKQPFITEAYVKYVYLPDPTPPSPYTKWLTTPDETESVYAVELYNPYPEYLYLDDFELQTTAGGNISLAGVVIPPYQYVVIANREDDVSNKWETNAVPLFAGATTSGPNQNLYVVGTHLTGTLKIGEEDVQDGIKLLRKTVLHLELDSVGRPVARLTRNAQVVVDKLKPSGIGGETHAAGVDAYAVDERFAMEYDASVDNLNCRPIEEVNGDVANDRLVWDSSLQRRKEIAGQPPTHWHFPLSQQLVFPVPWFEHPESGMAGAILDTRPTRPMQHNLLTTAPFVTTGSATVPAGLTNQAIIARVMDGVATVLGPFNPVPEVYPLPDGNKADLDRPEQIRYVVTNAADNTSTLAHYRENPIAPLQLVTSDLGLDAYGRCRAFPTTGTLLLIPRYAHLTLDGGSTYTPIAETAAARPSITSKDDLGFDTPLVRDETKQMVQVDNGHLPVFDRWQVVLGEYRRWDMPWGMLAFDYFTALPIEELFRYKDLAELRNRSIIELIQGTSRTVVDVLNEPNNPMRQYETAYRYMYSDIATPEPWPGFLPVNEVISTDGTQTIGPRLRGRININAAPWWVLDGLPVLADMYADPAQTQDYGTFRSLPVPQLQSAQLDPYGYPTDSRPAQRLLTDVLMDSTVTHSAGFPTISPAYARYLVSYREKRAVEGQLSDLALWASSDSTFPRNPGFVGAGALCEVPHRIVRGASFNGQALAAPASAEGQPTLSTLRMYYDPATKEKPYAYLGYLQMIAPVVRLQDWVTVKSHVYTMYNLIGDTADPPTWLRSQATIDRTRCIYTNDLPDRIAQTEPISYYNTVSDQQ